MWLPVNERPHSHRDSKQTRSFGVFCMILSTYLCCHCTQQPLCWCLQSEPGCFNELHHESTDEPMVGFFTERSLIYTAPIYPQEVLCGDEEGYKTEEDECQRRSRETLFFPTVGCISIGWQRHVHLFFGEGAEAASDTGQGRDVGKTVGDEPVSSQPQKDFFIISSAMFERLSSSPFSSWLFFFMSPYC